jgi:hypothetical protein
MLAMDVEQAPLELRCDLHPHHLRCTSFDLPLGLAKPSSSVASKVVSTGSVQCANHMDATLSSSDSSEYAWDQSVLVPSCSVCCQHRLERAWSCASCCFHVCFDCFLRIDKTILERDSFEVANDFTVSVSYGSLFYVTSLF